MHMFGAKLEIIKLAVWTLELKLFKNCIFYITKCKVNISGELVAYQIAKKDSETYFWYKFDPWLFKNAVK